MFVITLFRCPCYLENFAAVYVPLENGTGIVARYHSAIFNRQPDDIRCVTFKRVNLFGTFNAVDADVRARNNAEIPNEHENKKDVNNLSLILGRDF